MSNRYGQCILEILESDLLTGNCSRRSIRQSKTHGQFACRTKYINEFANYVEKNLTSTI
jgi:hypothetical protein